MTKHLVYLFLVTSLTTPVLAEPAQTQAPIFEIEKHDARADQPQQTVKLWRTGAWSFEETVKSKPTSSASGKLDDAQLKQARADLAAATWKTTPVIHCMMATNSSTTFKADGKVVFTLHACNEVKLDDASAKSLADLQTLLAPAWPKTGSSGSNAP
jgi:hypothetical protein